MEGLMAHSYEPWLLDLMSSDPEFLRKAGIEPCVVDDPAPHPPLEEVIR
jgi:hypothetical protein